MKHKRFLTVILAVAEVLSICQFTIPLASVTAAAEGDVSYLRRSPEVAIYNAYTGSSNEFYNNNITKDSPYNAAALFKNGNKELDFNAQVHDEAYTYDLSGTTLDIIRQAFNNLQTGASGEFINNHHSHSWNTGFLGLTKHTVNTISASNLEYSVCGGSSTRIYGMQYIKYSRFRGGNYEFSRMNEDPSKTELKINFTSSEYKYDGGNKVCKCGGHNVSKAVVAFKDDRAPYLKNIGGNINNGIFKAGDTITIELQYDEPIRFADDKADHGDLYVGLALSGYSSDRYPKAMLTKLEDDTLYFSYTVPSDETGTEKTITGIDLTPLNQECTLVQVKGSDSFTVSKPSDATSEIGYSKATSYITDLAGNSLEDDMYTISAYIDTKEPEISEIVATVYPNNSDIKAILGKTDPSDPSYPDASDQYLGIGDFILYKIDISEILNINEENAQQYYGMIAETNLRDKDGNVVEIKSNSMMQTNTPRSDQGLGASQGKITRFNMNLLYIEEGMTCVDADQQIRITKLVFDDTVYDLAGNSFNNFDVSSNLNTATCYLDTTPPEITTTAQIDENSGRYEVIPEDEGGFVFPFKISDKSGINGLKGGFSWLIYDENRVNGKFEYAVTTGDETPVWNEGSMGLYYEFEQVDAEQYIHIRRIEGEEYYFSDTSLMFYASDYAGNGHKKQNFSYVEFEIDTVWDTIPPNVTIGNTSRQLTDDGGLLSVEVKLDDLDLLKEAFYLWNDGETPEASEISEIPEGDILDQSTGTITVRANVNSGESFTKNLWVKVIDKSGNETICNLGEISYNLSDIKYALEYSKEIRSRLSIKVADIEANGRLLFLIPGPNFETDNKYYATFGQSFNMWSGAWFKLTDTTGDRRQFTVESFTDEDVDYFDYMIYGYKSDIFGYRNGNFNVYVISGQSESFTLDNLGRVTAAGNDSYPVNEEVIPFRLLADDRNAAGPDIYEGISVTVEGYIPESRTYIGAFNSKTEECQLTTFAGLTVHIDLGKDVHGWNHENVDYGNSYLEIIGKTSVKLNLKPQTVQSIDLPDIDYEKGHYYFRLTLNSYYGRSYYIIADRKADIDTTPAYEDFEMSSLTYEPYNYISYNTGVTKKDYLTDDECIYLPVVDGENRFTVKIGSTSVSENGIYTGRDLLIWNITAGQTQETASFPYTSTIETDIVICKDKAEAEKIISESIGTGNGRFVPLCLIENTINTLALRVLQSNGKDSEIKYYNIYPVNNSITGTVTTTMPENGGYVLNSGDLIFTPAEGQSMDGVRVYSVYMDENNEYHKQELLPQSDGTYRHELLPGQFTYYVHAIDKYGNVITITYSDDKIILDNEAPVISETEVNSEYGIYTVNFRLDDATLNDENITMPISMRFYFDDEYSKYLGIGSGESLEVVFDEFENYYNPGKVGTISTWEAESISSTGIYKVTAVRPNFEKYLNVTVYGVVKYDETAEETIDFTLYMDAEDEFGHAVTTSADITGQNVKPHILTDSGNEPQYINIEGFDYGLQMKFNVPVHPKKSWINPTPSGYSDTWVDGFPITNDGTWEVEFYDLFGGLYSEEITLTDAFTAVGIVDDKASLFDFGLNVSITPTELTGESVSISIDTDLEGELGTICVFTYGDDGRYSKVPGTDSYDYGVPKKSIDITVEDNQRIAVFYYSNRYTKEDIIDNAKFAYGDRLIINIDNIGKEAPAAESMFYLEQYGQEYTAEDLELAFPNGVSTTGKVEVWYETSRNVTSINNTGEIVTFRYGENTTHLFEYEDDLGNKGSWYVDLSDYGIHLAEPPIPPKDESSPDVKVDIYAKLFGSYSQMEGFTDDMGAAEIGQAFDNVGYVQDYSLKIKAYDDSNYKIVLLESVPSDLSYASAVSDTVNGVNISGNTITVTKDVASDFTVAVIDNAAEETGADSDNYTYFTIKIEDLINWFDNTKPEIITENVSNGLYEQTAYVTFRDKTDDGTELGSEYVILSSPNLELETSGTYAGWYKKVFTENTSENIIFYDHVGNVGDIATIGASGIDTEPPEIKITWTPPYKTQDGKIDDESYTSGPINTSVYAHISSNKEIDVQNVYCESYSLNGTDWIDIQGGDINDLPDDIISCTVNSDQIDVCFTAGGIGLRLQIPSANGKYTVAEVYLPQNVIDTTAPNINKTINPLIRNGATAPYAAEVILKPNEAVYCSNYGNAGTEYSEYSPFSVIIKENGTHKFLFVDKAGNRSEVSVDITDIDREAPKLTVTPDLSKEPVTNLEQKVTITPDEDCQLSFNGDVFSLSAGEGKELSFENNGVYTVTATDMAGNESILNIPVGNIDKTPPNISFDKLTIRIRQDSEMTELKAALDEGITVWDPYSDTVPTWSYETDGNGNPLVDLSTVGIYNVVYTVKDAAGNTAQLTRYIAVYDKNQPGIYIDGELAEAEGTVIISSGEHILTVSNIQEIAPGVLEPYTLKITKGIATTGQMKYEESDVVVEEDGTFSIDPGFYTLVVTTQSRKTFRTILYVEK